MLHTMRVHSEITGGERSPGHFPLSFFKSQSSCCPNVDLNDQSVHGLYSGEVRHESRGALVDRCGATDTEERVLKVA